MGHPARDLPRHVRRRVPGAWPRARAADHRGHRGRSRTCYGSARFPPRLAVVALLLIRASASRSWPASTAAPRIGRRPEGLTARPTMSAAAPSVARCWASSRRCVQGVSSIDLIAAAAVVLAWTRSTPAAATPPRRPIAPPSWPAGLALCAYMAVAVGLVALMRVDGSPGARRRRPLADRRRCSSSSGPARRASFARFDVVPPRGGAVVSRRRPSSESALGSSRCSASTTNLAVLSRNDAPWPPMIRAARRHEPAPVSAHGPMGNVFAQLVDCVPWTSGSLAGGAGHSPRTAAGRRLPFFEMIVDRVVAEDQTASGSLQGRAGVDVDPGRRRRRRVAKEPTPLPTS